MYLGDGAHGVLTSTSPYTTPVAMYAIDVALADVDHDGKLDLAAVGEDPALHLGRLSFWFGDGGDTWTEAHPPNAQADSSVVALGPLNDDGLLDLVAVKADGDIWPWVAGDFNGPTGWFPYTPTGWVTDTRYPTCTAAVHDSLSWLDVHSAYYAFSTSGGGGWSDWQEAQCSGSDAVTTTQWITAANVPFDRDSGLTDRNKIRYLIRDVAGNWSLSGERSVQIDTTPPENPIALESTSHPQWGWSSDTTVDLQWSGASDGSSGVDGFSLAWTESSTTTPDTVLETHGSSTTSGSLADGRWYFHARTADVAGNWAVDAEHLGPFGIDTTPPTSPDTVWSDSHTVDQWSNDDTVTARWSGADDGAGGGVDGYGVSWTHSDSSIPAAVMDTHTGSITSNSLADDDDWYFHVRAVDDAGNWAAGAAHLGPFKIDTAAPTNPTSRWSTSHTVGQWSSDDTVEVH